MLHVIFAWHLQERLPGELRQRKERGRKDEQKRNKGVAKAA